MRNLIEVGFFPLTFLPAILGKPAAGNLNFHLNALLLKGKFPSLKFPAIGTEKQKIPLYNREKGFLKNQ